MGKDAIRRASTDTAPVAADTQRQEKQEEKRPREEPRLTESRNVIGLSPSKGAHETLRGALALVTRRKLLQIPRPRRACLEP